MKQAFALLGLIFALALVGCGGPSGPPTAQAKGKVTVAGKGPLTGGAIQFILVSDNKQVGGGNIQPDGTYDVNAPIGECKVTISTDHLKTGGPTGGMGAGGPPKGKSDAMSKAPPGVTAPPGGMGGMGTPTYTPIDPSFASFDSTPLKSTVSSSGATPSDFEVK